MSNPFYLGMPNYIDMLNQLWNKVGTTGPQGDPGPAGTGGSTAIHFGTGDPNAVTIPATVGDYYIDELSSVTYRLSADSPVMWVIVGSIPGSTSFNTLFADMFNGSDDLSTHIPDIGSAYSSSGTLSSMALDGMGNMTSGDGAYAVSAIQGTAGSTYTLTFKFTPPSATRNAFLDISAYVPIGARWLAEAYIVVDGSGVWTFFASIVDGIVTYNNPTVISPILDAENTVAIDVTPTGVTWALNGVQIDTTATPSGVLPTAVIVGNGDGGGIIGTIEVSSIILTGAPGTVRSIYDHTKGTATITASDVGGTVTIDWSAASDYLVNVDTEITAISFIDPPSTGFEFGIPLTLTFKMDTSGSNKIDIAAFDGIAMAEKTSGLWGHRTFKFDADLGVENGALWRLRFTYIPEGSDGGNYHVDYESFYGKYGVYPNFGSRWQVTKYRHLVIDGAFANQATQVHNAALSNAPATGGTVTIANDIDMLALEPAGTLSTLTINLPEGVLDGQTVTILSTQIVTTVTIADPASNTIIGSPASLAANTPIAYRWVELPKNATDGTTVHTWYRYR